MPTSPQWLSKIDQICEVLEARPHVILSRHDVSALFSIGRTEATRLLRNAGGERIGPGGQGIWQISAALLLDWVRSRQPEADRNQIQAETRQGIMRGLDPKWRKREFTTWDRIPHDIESWPETVTVEPGVLHIYYTGAIDLYETFMRIAQILADDEKSVLKKLGITVSTPGV